MTEVRSASVDDFPEMLRLAHLLWDDMGIAGKPGPWEGRSLEFFEESLDSGDIVGFVADHPTESDRLVSCGLGVIYRLMPAYWLPTGEMGYVQWFCTEPDFRRQGLATEILARVLEWFDEQGVTRIQLHASEDALSVYKKAGFEESLFSNLWHRK